MLTKHHWYVQCDWSTKKNRFIWAYISPARGMCRNARTSMSSNLEAIPASIPSSLSYSLPYNLTTPSLSSLSQTTHATWLWTTLAIVASLLVIEQTVYRYKKRHLPGATWTIPIIGKFADSMHPTMENYKKQWDSGALSAISVFNMYVLLSII